MEKTILYRIRVKCKPDMYIGKTNPTCGLMCDVDIKTTANNRRLKLTDPWLILSQNDPYHPPHWYVPFNKAKIWTEISQVKKFVKITGSYTRCDLFADEDFEAYPTWSQFEIVVGDEETIIPLDYFMESM